jgi:hypothetical protein
VLVGSDNGLLRQVVERTGGGLAYRGALELGAVLRLLDEDRVLADGLGRQGARARDEEHLWPGVLDRVEAVLAEAAARPRSAA